MKQRLSADFENPDNMLLGFIGRAVEQKFKLLAEVINGKSVLEHILDIPGINIIILTSGLQEYEALVSNISVKKPFEKRGHDQSFRNMRRANYAYFIGFDAEKAQQIILGSDILLMPSLFEPGSIALLQALSKATPPLARWTGIFVDVVKPSTHVDGNGFGFDGIDKDDLLLNLIKTVKDAFEIYTNDKKTFERLQRNGFNQRFEGWFTIG